jgi:hypothetical protein
MAPNHDGNNDTETLHEPRVGDTGSRDGDRRTANGDTLMKAQAKKLHQAGAIDGSMEAELMAPSTVYRSGENHINNTPQYTPEYLAAHPEYTVGDASEMPIFVKAMKHQQEKDAAARSVLDDFKAGRIDEEGNAISTKIPATEDAAPPASNGVKPNKPAEIVASAPVAPRKVLLLPPPPAAVPKPQVGVEDPPPPKGQTKGPGTIPPPRSDSRARGKETWESMAVKLQHSMVQGQSYNLPTNVDTTRKAAPTAVRGRTNLVGEAVVPAPVSRSVPAIGRKARGRPQSGGRSNIPGTSAFAVTAVGHAALKRRDKTKLTHALSALDEYTGETTESDGGDSSDDGSLSNSQTGRDKKPKLEFSQARNSTGMLFASLEKATGTAYPPLGFFSTATREGKNAKWQSSDGAIISYNPNLPICGKAASPDFYKKISDEICPSWKPAQPYLPPYFSSPPPEHLQPPSRPVGEAAKTVPIIISSGPPHAASPPPQQATEPREEQPLEPLWGNPDYEDFDYSKARALCQQRRIPNTGSVVTIRNHLIRDDTNMCTGKDREYALLQDRKYYTHKIRKRTRGGPTGEPETAATGSGEPEDDAGDEREPGDGFEFDLDLDDMDWEINALPNNQPQLQEDPVLASGAQTAPLAANKPEEMDWKAGVAMAQAEGIPEPAAGQPGVHRVRVSKPQATRQGETRSRESSLSSIAHPITPPPNEGPIVGRRRVTGSRIRRERAEVPDSDSDDAFESADDLRKSNNPTPHPNPPTPEPENCGRACSALPASPYRTRNPRAQDTRRSETRSRESSIDSGIFPNNNIVIDNSNIVDRLAELRRIKREQGPEPKVSDTDNEDGFENLKDLRAEAEAKKLVVEKEECRKENMRIEREILAQMMIKKEH